MAKYYEVLEDTPIWVKGAIIKGGDGNGYTAVDEVFHAHNEVGSEYLSSRVVEHEENAKFFKRVYPINLGAKVVYRTKEAAKEFLKGEFKEE